MENGAFWQFCRVRTVEGWDVVEVLEYAPCHFLDFVAGIDHVDAGIDAYSVLHFDGHDAGVSVRVLRFAFEAVELVCVLQL